ncbi:MAG: LLM class flavin-dependent oxidoreductase, partial [Gammaproteobacteria bacterium]|nr:LLM class flavin-dependent oxidoreductase [Gammaproteobacteria bacterium]
ASGEREFIGASPMIEPFVLASTLAGVTSRIELVTFVAKLAVRNPVLTAKTVSSLAVMSDNRFHFGVGLSPWPEDFLVCDAEWRNRGKRMDEQIEILRGLFSGDFFEYKGAYYELPAIKINPAPSAPVPIYIGGHSEPALRRAAILGDGWMHAGGDKDDFAPLLERLKQLREEHGTADRPFRIYVISMGAFSPQGIEQLEAAGVTDVIVGFRNAYDPSTQSMGVQEKIDALSGYAAAMIQQ